MNIIIIKNIFINKLLILGLAFAVIGCKKEIVSNANPIEGEAKFVFTIKGVGNELDGVNNKVASTSNLIDKENEVHFASLSKQVGLVAKSMGTNRSSDFGVLNNIQQDKNVTKRASVVPVDHDVRYRLLLFDSQADTLVVNLEAKVNQTLSVNVTPGRSYHWRAYTHNSKEPMAPLIISNNEFKIETSIDQDLLWDASDSPVTATTKTDSLAVVFDFKVGEFVVNLDVDDLYGDITDLVMEFDSPNYFKKGLLDIKTGVVSNISSFNRSVLSRSDFEKVPDSKILQAKFYTVDPTSVTDFTLNLKKLTILQDNNSSIELHKTSDPIKNIDFLFNPSLSKSHVASMAFRYKIPKKTILHVTGILHSDDYKFSFAAQPTPATAGGPRDYKWEDTWNASDHRPPFNMIKTPRNYGTLLNSIVYTDGFEHRRCLDDGSLDQKLNPPGDTKPDIVIMTIYYQMDENDIIALIDYVNNNGVLIMMSDSSFPNEITATQTFLRDLFGRQGISVSAASGYNGGTLFRLETNIHDRIMNGKFGDLNGQFWGVDTHNVLTVNGLSVGDGEEQVTYMSEIQPYNKPINVSLGASMFKHNSKNLFWIGNGSFLSTLSNQSLNIREYFTAEPFGIVVEGSADFYNPNTDLNYNYYPIPKKYGVDNNTDKIGYSYGTKAYNSTLFANLMHWALYRSELFGINPRNL